jgi:hypothetical protein
VGGEEEKGRMMETSGRRGEKWWDIGDEREGEGWDDRDEWEEKGRMMEMSGRRGGEGWDDGDE